MDVEIFNILGHSVYVLALLFAYVPKIVHVHLIRYRVVRPVSHFAPESLPGRGGLVVNTLDSGSRGPGFEPHSGHGVVSLSKTYLPPKVLVIPRKRWLRPNMTEKLFTGMLSIKPNQT